MILLILAALFGQPAHAIFEMPTTDYNYVSASATSQLLGPNGKKGDILQEMLIVPETTAAGTVSIQDGTGAARNVFVSGTLSDLKPISLLLGMRSVSGGWSVTTGSNVHVIAIGRFD